MRSKPNHAQTEKHFSDRYLKFYAETEASVISQLPPHLLSKKTFKNILIIPAYNEDEEFLVRLQKHSVRHCVFILVINSPDDKTNTDYNNFELHKKAQCSGETLWEAENSQVIEWDNDNLLIIIDRFSDTRKIPRKQGVGLARKIACDIAVQLIQKKIIDSRFIHSTDADATLPDNYFSQTDDLSKSINISAATYNFSHTKNDTDISEATQIYELSMRYYVDGLRWAQSQYAFHTIGSCLALSAEHYCKVRGFPKKSGGEDFYLLNKLAKLGSIHSLNDKPIIISSRESNRVPFGTGPAVSKIITSEKKLNYPVYNPEVFIQLKELLKQFKALTNSLSSIEHYEKWLHLLSRETKAALESLNIEQLFQHLRTNCKNNSQIQEHINGWFDGFKTLKYIHYLQQHTYPPIPLNQALTQSKILKF